MQSHLIIKPRLSLPSKPRALKPSQIPTKPLLSARRPDYKHTLSMAVHQFIYAFVAGGLSSTAWFCLAGMAVYRVVALVVIGILWSSFAGRAALRRPVDMMETVSLPAFPVGNYTDETYAYLKAIKKNLLERK
jgi:hypothetical protein